MSDGADQIRAERGRQIVTEGYSAEYDLTAGGAQPLIAAAEAYVISANDAIRLDEAAARWPWPRQTFKPTTMKRDLVKAGALIAAAIDQIDLEAASQTPLDNRGFEFGSQSADEAHDEEYR